ncbi:MAG: aldose 1-epimerase family protein [Kiritimatiellae bacterium]|nr:aldose 1-epimerase family protein [Kiritimatiellia bacterium]
MECEKVCGGGRLAKVGSAEQICMAQRVQVTDGRGNGARQIYVANGKLNFVLSESNALDILRLWHGGTNIGFVSKNGLYTAPADFLGAFPAGMLYTCGLDAIGGVEGHPIHGRIHSIPAQVREISADEDGVRVVADIRDTALFGQNLAVTRTVTTAAGSDEVRIEDRIENRAFRDEKYCMLYHVNVGYPVVDAGAKVSGNFVRSLPRTAWAEHEMAKMLEVEPPLDNAEETCYFHETADGRMSIENAALGKRFTVESSLRRFVQWKSRASGDYVVGLEPCTSWLDDKLEYSTLRPGESVTHSLVLRAEDVR